MNLSGESLLYMWKESGLSQREFAKQHGWNFNKVHGLIYRAQQHETMAGDEKISVTEQYNDKIINAHTSRIKTLDDLIKACGIDLEEWLIEKHIINKWEVGAKINKGKLEWEAGVVTGDLEYPGQLTIEPLFQVKVWLVKRHPEIVHPVVTPVQIDWKPVKFPTQSTEEIAMSLVLPDPHFGFSKSMAGELINFHDRKALSVALKIASSYLFENIIFLGDILDLADWTDRFLRSPEVRQTTQPAVIEAVWWLSQFRQVCPTATIIVMEGNHEKRLNDSLVKHMAQAYELRPGLMTDGPALMSIPNLLSLSDLGIEYVGDYPNGEVWLGDVRCTHGIKARSKSGSTAVAVVDEARTSEVFGHIHRIEMATKTLWGREPKTITAFSPGCLCRIDGVVPANKKKMNWQQGIGIVCEDVCTSVPINNGRAIFNGRVFEAEDVLDQIDLELTPAVT